MNPSIRPPVLPILLAFALAPAPAVADPPGVINHQGRIAVGGTNHNGQAYFKFALVTGGAAGTLWTNNNTGVGTPGGEPGAAVQVSVTNGHYAVGLGDTNLANMTSPIPASIFAEHDDIQLRIWLSTDNATFELLSPDQPISSVGYALSAAKAAGVMSGSVSDLSFFGTTTSAPLDLSVNNQRALRIEHADAAPFGPSPNMIGGHVENSAGLGSGGAVIGGGGAAGSPNTVLGIFTTVSGGRGNAASNQYASVGGGLNNTASGFLSVVGGGSNNTAAGPRSTIPGGSANITTATAEHAFAAGQRAIANHTGTFVWSDSEASDFSSSGADQFLIRAGGGVGIGTGDPATGLHLAAPLVNYKGQFVIESPFPSTDTMSTATITGYGSDLGTGSAGRLWAFGSESTGNHDMAILNSLNGTLKLGTNNSPYVFLKNENLGIGVSDPTEKLEVAGNVECVTAIITSDRNAKTGFEAVDPQEVLEKVADLPVERWYYKSDPGTPHVGPVAQDFHAAFGLGADDKHIATVDADGVALAAIKGLHEVVREKDAEIEALKEKVTAMETRFAVLEDALEECRQFNCESSR